ncbi:uncharacterized protein LOC110841596 [Folsomia candida]|uniref:uncharacterized protein LOC110841596 n=1 Tax=Folsomia candida TaxID=158441 RepID=UPI000B8EF3BA|nr:uncharacterized protein LOC110841596 [Folsomia candida]
MISVRNLFCIFLLCGILSKSDAGFSQGEPGTDPYGFGNVKETCKTPPFIAANFNPAWTSTYPELYFVMMSKEHLTRLTQHLFHSVAVPPLTQDDLDHGCFTLTQYPLNGGSQHTVTGYGNLTLDQFVYPLGFPGFLRFDKMFERGDVGGVSVLSLSNNLSFNLGVACFDDGAGTWLVSSPNKCLTEIETYAISQHLLSLGFNPDNFVSVDFNKC